MLQLEVFIRLYYEVYFIIYIKTHKLTCCIYLLFSLLYTIPVVSFNMLTCGATMFSIMLVTVTLPEMFRPEMRESLGGPALGVGVGLISR